MIAIVKLKRIRELEEENDRYERLHRADEQEIASLQKALHEAHQFVGDSIRLSDDMARHLRNAETRLRG